FDQWVNGTQLEQRLRLEDYSVSNRGLRSGLVGTPDQIAARVREFEDAGVELLLLQFSPQAEEMERFAEQVIARSSRPRPESPDSVLTFAGGVGRARGASSSHELAAVQQPFAGRHRTRNL